MATPNETPVPRGIFGNRQFGDPEWTPMDLFPGKWAWDAIDRAITPNFVPDASTMQNTFADGTKWDYQQTLAGAAKAQADARAEQEQLNAMIRARAMGRGPSIAQMQLQQATDRLQQQQAGQVASQRGMNPALQRRLIMSQGADLAQQMNAQGALLRAQEQQAAQALLGQQLAGMRGQDQSMFGTGAEGQQGQRSLDLQAQMANQRAEIERQQMLAAQAQQAAQNRAAFLGAVAGIGERVVGASLGDGGVSFDPLGTGVLPTARYGANTAAHSSQLGTAESLYSGGGAFKRHGGLSKMSFSSGGMVPGYAQGGDNPSNDTVPAWLSPGEAVIPRSVMRAPDAPAKAAQFVAMLKSSGGTGPVSQMPPQRAREGGALAFLRSMGEK